MRSYAWILLPLLAWRIDAVLASESIPVIGCPSDGQAGPFDPPANSVASLEADPKIARQLAYYQAAESVGVLAPRGWQCFGVYGFSGNILIVAPTRIDSSNLSEPKVPGPGVAMTVIFGGTSGRLEVARYAARFFPERVPSFVSAANREIDELEMPELRASPSFATDTYRCVALSIVRFETPGSHAGVGTTGPLVKSTDSVSGLIALTVTDDGPDLSILRVRLSPQQRALTDAILRTMQSAAQN